MSRPLLAVRPTGCTLTSPRAWGARVLATTLSHWGPATQPSDDGVAPDPAAGKPRSLLMQGAIIAANSRLGRRFVLTRKRPDLEPNPPLVHFDSGWHAMNIGAPRRFAI